ncbi:hypothetical protein EYZ11_011927 [Aspergillus tanneri]|uniref:Uncharacterized protein n=1 Tax=Aspergillus tanneri TaxID=1220188 RepID=A0A4V3UMU1_9EURO|nr:hypothetical protein EYZ11_011927 [Aspergillus tanneri]
MGEIIDVSRRLVLNQTVVYHLVRPLVIAWAEFGKGGVK